MNECIKSKINNQALITHYTYVKKITMSTLICQTIPSTVPKTFYFHFFRAFTVLSQCVHRVFTCALRSALFPKHSPCIHKVFTLCSPFVQRSSCAHRLFIVNLSFSHIIFRLITIYMCSLFVIFSDYRQSTM